MPPPSLSTSKSNSAVFASEPVSYIVNLQTLLADVAELPGFYGRIVDSVHCRADTGDTPLHAVIHWNDLGVIKLLLEHGSDVNAIGEMGKTVLHYAVGDRNLDTARFLLQNGARSDIKDDFGLSPKDIAVTKGVPIKWSEEERGQVT